MKVLLLNVVATDAVHAAATWVAELPLKRAVAQRRRGDFLHEDTPPSPPLEMLFWALAELPVKVQPVSVAVTPVNVHQASALE